MRLLWSDYLDQDGARDAYNEHAEKLPGLIVQGENAMTNSRSLHDNKTLTLLTKSAMGGEVQVTHHHEIRGSELVGNQETFGLLGFGVQATALKMDISTLFCISTVKKHVPSLQQLLDCDTLEKLRELKPDVSTMNE